MARRKPVGKQVNPDEMEKKQALGIAMFGTAEEYQSISAIFGEGFEDIVAPSKTEAGKPPRAHYCGYHAKAQLLVIIFRGPGKTVKGKWIEDTGKPQPWIFYDGIDQDTWESLKNARSTGDWLRDELDGYPWSGVPGNTKSGLKTVVNSILQA
jgi:hypothetical protein